MLKNIHKIYLVVKWKRGENNRENKLSTLFLLGYKVIKYYKKEMGEDEIVQKKETSNIVGSTQDDFEEEWTTN